MEVLHIQHYAVIKQDVYEWKYRINMTPEYGTGCVIKKGIDVDCGLTFYNKSLYSIIRESEEEPNVQVIVDGLINIPPMKVDGTFYHPDLDEEFLVKSVVRGIDGKYYYEVKPKTIDPIGSKEQLERLKEEQKMLLESYWESKKELVRSQDEETFDNLLKERVDTAKKKKWKWF